MTIGYDEAQLKLSQMTQEEFNRLVIECLYELMSYKIRYHYSTKADELNEKLKSLVELFKAYPMRNRNETN